MNQSLKWLPDADGTAWKTLGDAMRSGLSVPPGYIVSPSTSEEDIRAAYEELKFREKTHFLAVRGPSHAVLNVIGPDPLIHALRRLWLELPDSPVLVQLMINAMWCGKAQLHRENLQIEANEGMMLFDPDIYLVNSVTGEGARQTSAPRQRKMIRHVDGSARVVEREGERTPIPAELLAKISELAARAGTDIGWTIDDRDRVWLISRG